MGKKMDAFLGRSFKTAKFKSLLNLALSRLSILQNQRHSRYSLSKSDVSELLRLGHHSSALLRVDNLILDRNLLDVFLILHRYFSLLLDRLHLVEAHRECPDELREAVSSLIFAASRLGDFPELLQIRDVLTSRFGKDLAARSIELRSHSGVNSIMVQKLSTRQPPTEVRMDALQEIAAENNIVLKLDDSSTSSQQQKPDNSDVSNSELPGNDGGDTSQESGYDHGIRTKKKYKDVADAAQAAFESAAYAAAAARAAVMLSLSDPRGPDDHDNPSHIHKKQSAKGIEENQSESESEHEGSKRSISNSSNDSEEVIMEVGAMSCTEDPIKLLEKDVVIYDSEEETQHSTTKAAEVRGHGHHMAHRAGAKGPVSVRTREVRGY